MSQDLKFLPATEALSKFASGALSPTDLLEAVLKAAEAQQPQVNAATAMFADDARRQAREAEARWKGGTARALEGIPVIVKEETAVKGWPQTFGSMLMSTVNEYDYPVIDKLKQAGAILHMQATNPEFCTAATTSSKRWGVTRNPWNLEISPGGSSGGSSAALASGCGPLATGSDMGGSIRVPAALCGLYGYKAPFGRLPASPGLELFSYGVDGPLARTLADVTLMHNVMAGPHPMTYTTIPFEPIPRSWTDSLRGVRIAYCPSLGAKAIQPDVQANMDKAVRALEAQGASVEVVEIVVDEQALEEAFYDGILGLCMAEYLEMVPEEAIPALSPQNARLIQRLRARRPSIIAAAKFSSALHAEFQQKVWGAGFDALICATTLTTDVPADLQPTETPTIDIEGKPFGSEFGWALTPPFNMLSRYPVMAVPTGRSGGSGVPTSMQIVGAPYNDPIVFRIASHHEKAGVSRLFIDEFPSLVA